MILLTALCIGAWTGNGSWSNYPHATTMTGLVTQGRINQCAALVFDTGSNNAVDQQRHSGHLLGCIASGVAMHAVVPPESDAC
jgi:hypothetical protein